MLPVNAFLFFSTLSLHTSSSDARNGRFSHWRSVVCAAGLNRIRALVYTGSYGLDFLFSWKLNIAGLLSNRVCNKLHIKSAVSLCSNNAGSVFGFRVKPSRLWVFLSKRSTTLCSIAAMPGCSSSHTGFSGGVSGDISGIDKFFHKVHFRLILLGSAVVGPEGFYFILIALFPIYPDTGF